MKGLSPIAGAVVAVRGGSGLRQTIVLQRRSLSGEAVDPNGGPRQPLQPFSTMDNTPLVSVVMSVYNGERFLREAIESILNQTFRNFEFIIINDGSTDGTAGIIAQYASADARLRVFEQPNQGLIYSLNKGCALARGKYIARIDADDIAVPERLERQVNFLAQSPDVAVLGGGFYLMGSGEAVVRTALLPQLDFDIKRVLRDAWCAIIHPTVMMRTDAFSAVGGYRKAFVAAEDYDLWLRLAERAALANLPEPLLYKRAHPEQVSHMRLEAQVTASVAARAAAKWRAQGNPDPFDEIQELAPENLAKVGVTKRELADAMALSYCQAAVSFSTAGYADHAEILLQHGITACAGWPLSRVGAAELHWASAKLHLRQRRIARALVAALRTFCAKPAMMFDLLTSTFWKRLAKFVRRPAVLQRGRDARTVAG